MSTGRGEDKNKKKPLLLALSPTPSICAMPVLLLKHKILLMLMEKSLHFLKQPHP